MRTSLTVVALEAEIGVMGIFDQGSCGRNTSVLRAPMLAPGDRVDLLVHAVGRMEGLGGSVEVFAIWIKRARD